ncbi:lectin-like domain-containing protein, partial [Levilactobacillus brevis]|uniref:lectin-like domain-containing protein n=1 Tax=Levilactobacillus brevis TaxID=1580 RepID=UPI00298D314F
MCNLPKDGKKIVFAAIATFSIFVVGGVSTVEVHADTVSKNTSTATASSTSDMKSAAPSTATTAASSASDTKSAAPSTVTTAASSSSNTKSVAPSSATTAASSSSDTKSAASSTAATAASSSSDTKSVVPSTATGTASTEVTKDNFSQYFDLNGSAKNNYDQSTGIVTITPDDNNQVGNFALKSKIDTNSSFTLTGQVNLGSDPNGADGIGFAFHNGNTTDIGNAGGNLGIGGLQDALGFKLDTYKNGYKSPQSDKDGSQIDPTNSNGFGLNGDSMSAPYGTFVTTSDEQIKSQDGTPVQRWWAQDVAGSAQALSTSDVDGKLHDFTVHYDGTTRTVTVSYTQTGGTVLTWSQKVADSYKAVAFIVSASTGGAKNLQQFKITSFDFKQAATVNVKYVDTKGNQIAQGKVTYPNGPDVNGAYTTGQLEIPNYKFVRMDNGTATGAESLPATGTLTKAGDNGTVIYVYAPNQEAANVTYIDDTTVTTLSAKDLTGDYGSTDPYRTGDTIADYEKQGYQLVSNNYPTDGVVYNQDGTVQSFAVHLKHQLTPVSPTDPQTPGAPINPDEPDGPKWPT